MNKLIQSFVLTAIVSSPISLVSSAISAEAHHSSSHVSTVALNGTKTRKSKMKKGKKPVTTGNTNKKPSTDATTTDPTTQPASGMPASGDTMPAKINKTTKPDTTITTPVDGSMTKPSGSTGTNVPNVPSTVPGGVSAPTGVPSVKPSLPNLPTGLPK